MIQRIQTLYLMLAVAAMAACLMFPIATFDMPETSAGTMSGELRLLPHEGALQGEVAGVPMVLSQKNFINLWPLWAVLAIAAVTTVVSIFLSQNRVRQMRLVMLPFLMTLVYVFLVFLWAVDAFVGNVTRPLALPDTATDVHVVYGIGTWAAAVALLFLFLANRAIKKDEAKVRAADRLR